MNKREKSEQRELRILLLINCVMFISHIYVNQADLKYFCQLTVIGQILVILNFYFSLLLHQNKAKLETQLLLSRFHLITLSLQSIIVIGFWSLRVFFPKGIIQGQQRTFIIQFLSLYMHGGSFLTMFYFIKRDQVLTETQKKKKIISHLLWAVPFAIIQYLRWNITGQHIYGFIKYFSWLQLIVFQTTLFFIAVYCDYFISVRHGFKLLKNLQQHGSRTIIHVSDTKQE